MRTITPLLVSALALSITPAMAQEQIIPKPASISLSKGAPVCITADSVIFVDTNNKSLVEQAKFIRDLIKEGTGMKLELVSAMSKRARTAQDITLALEPALKNKGSEAYCLSSDAHGIHMTGAQVKGIYYAFVSFSQMLPTAFHDTSADKSTVKWVASDNYFKILDAPRFEWRGFMLDEARHFFGVDEVKKILDQMALLKMNVLHWHLTNDAGWRIEIKKYPLLTEIGSKRKESEIGTWKSGESDGIPHEGFYTQEQIKDVVAYAAARNITIVPEICVPGHFGAAAVAYPELSFKAPAEVPTTFIDNIAIDPTNQKSYDFLSDVYDEIIPLFPSGIIHTGGDEVRHDAQWKDVPEIEAFMKKHKFTALNDVQMYFTNKVVKMLKQKGRRAMGWNEIMGFDLNGDGGGTATGTLDRSAIIHFWKGSTELAKKAIREGHEVVNSSAGYTYLDYSYTSVHLEKAYNFEPIFGGLSANEAKRVKGLGCQMWTEWVQTPDRLHYQAFPRTVAYAEVGWTDTKNKDFINFKKRLETYNKRMDVMGIAYAMDAASALTLSDFFNTPLVGTWTPEDFNGQEMLIDVTKTMTTTGQYQASFMHTKGGHGLVIRDVALFEDDKEVARDTHEGFSGYDKRNVQYRLKLGEFNDKAKYSLRIKLDNKSQLDSNGNIYMSAP